MSSSEQTNGSENNLVITSAWERSVVPAAGGEAYLLVRIVTSQASSGTRRAPVDVAFVLDRSGSMAGDKIRLAKEAVDAAITHLTDEDRAALVVYDDQIDTLQHLEPATPRVKTAIRLTLNGIDPGASTDLCGGWLTGCGELSRDLPAPESLANTPLRIRRSLLLTDGLANVGITRDTEITKHATELRKRGVSTTTLGVGLDFNEELLSAMAEAGGGNFQFIEHAGQLRAFFERELGELLTIAAAGLTISLKMPHGVRARLLNSYPAERAGKHVNVAIGELPAGEEVNLIFKLKIAPGAAGNLHQLSLEANWTDPTADARRSLCPDLAALLLADQKAVDAAPIDETVGEKVALERANADQREAIRLDRAGRHAESRAQLREMASYLQVAPSSARVQAKLSRVEYLASFADDATYDESTRKQATFEAHYDSRRTRREEEKEES
jgi:Ca-activated chloride channel family protein